MNHSEDMGWYDWAKARTLPGMAPAKPEALENLVVLDISYGNIGGLVCSSVLSEMGALVIRIEPPEGDIAREYTPFGFKHHETGLGYLAEARNKYHITLNISSPEGREMQPPQLFGGRG